VSASTAAAVPTPRGWRERLPPEIGQDVIAVASELQYLRVWTPRGCALILGALADVESEDALHGVRVHRSWWVAANHVSSVRRTTSGAICVMSNGRRVPVSRRRRAEVLARVGDGARYLVPVASEPVPHPELHRQRVVAR
jgi:DNA-binding LytR/AlgR family response regulator